MVWFQARPLIYLLTLTSRRSMLLAPTWSTTLWAVTVWRMTSPTTIRQVRVAKSLATRPTRSGALLRQERKPPTLPVILSAWETPLKIAFTPTGSLPISN